MRRALLIAAAVGLAALLGRLSAPRSEGGQIARPATHLVAGVDVGYPHSPAGAALAAAGYQRAFADRNVLGPGALRRRIEAVATAEFAPKMLAANSPGTERLAAGPIGRGLETQIPTVFFAVPIGRRLISYSPKRAKVLTWGFTLLGNAASVEPAAYFGSARTELIWTGGRWRIAFNRAAFGPTPRLATPRHGGEGFDVIDLTRELEPYGIAP
jgi:hypothetical protein